MKNHIIKDKKFRALVNKEGKKALERIKNLNRLEDHNSQTIYSTWKTAVLEMAKTRDKMIVPKYERNMEALKSELNDVWNSLKLDGQVIVSMKRNSE